MVNPFAFLVEKCFEYEAVSVHRLISNLAILQLGRLSQRQVNGCCLGCSAEIACAASRPFVRYSCLHESVPQRLDGSVNAQRHEKSSKCKVHAAVMSLTTNA